MPNWFEARRQARRDIHAAFSLSASYTDPSLTDPVEGLSVRWHDRFAAPVGDIGGGDYARTFENIDRIVFDTDELTEKGLAPKRGGQVTLTDYGYTLTLDVREPSDGPVKTVWTVTRL
jgi:hypothetical protein